MAPATFVYSRTYPASPDAAFGTVIGVPLQQIFDRWYGPLPPIRSISDFEGVWGERGQTRTVHLTGGGSMREELVQVDRPGVFGYRLDAITGALKPIVSHMDGSWTFEPAGTGVRVTWQWIVHPTNALTARVLPVLGRLWQGYARLSFERIEDLLVD